MKTLREIWGNLDLTDVRIQVHKNAYIKSRAYDKATAKSRRSNGSRVFCSNIAALQLTGSDECCSIMRVKED